MNGTGMRVSDWLTFHRAAQAFGQWILVRWTNPASLNYIGKRTWDPTRNLTLTYYPKPIDCKPKTADINLHTYELAGLVVDPTIHPAFARDAKIVAATEAWQKFLKSFGAHDSNELNRISLTSLGVPLDVPRLEQVMHVSATREGVPPDRLRELNRRPENFAGKRCFMVDLDPASRHYGCLMFNGMYLHGDYDLKDIIDPRKLGPNTALSERLHGQAHMRSREFVPIRDYVNAAIGVPMLQHGGEAQYAGHSQDTIEVFGPHGQAHTLSGRDEIVKWYQYGWNRQTIDPKANAPGSYLAPASRMCVPMSSGGLVLIGADPRNN